MRPAVRTLPRPAAAPFLALALLLIATPPAFAADLSGPETFAEDGGFRDQRGSLFAGAYVGVEAGVSGSAARVEGGGGRKTLSRLDAAFGLFGGYNWQMERLVVGVEGSATYLGGRMKTAQVGTLSDVRSHSPWSVGLKGRIGLPVGSMMPYLSAGLAATGHSFRAQGLATKSSVFISPTVGAGLEMAVTDALRLRADYTLTLIGIDKHRLGATTIKEGAGNHRLMLGAAYAF